MKAPQITPGEWYPGSYCVGSNNGEHLANCYNERANDEGRANARMMAASKSALEMLNILHEDMDRGRSINPYEYAARCRDILLAAGYTE